MSETRLARLEGDVAAGAKAENAYLALSSLAYGYYRLSQRVAAAEGADPRFLVRLEQWNALLAVAYDTSGEDTDFRRAVREAALDLQRNAPPVRLRCVDERGETTECDSTDAVMRGIDAAASEVGIRGALERLLERSRKQIENGSLAIAEQLYAKLHRYYFRSAGESARRQAQELREIIERKRRESGARSEDHLTSTSR